MCGCRGSGAGRGCQRSFAKEILSAVTHPMIESRINSSALIEPVSSAMTRSLAPPSNELPTLRRQQHPRIDRPSQRPLSTHRRQLRLHLRLHMSDRDRLLL